MSPPPVPRARGTHSAPPGLSRYHWQPRALTDPPHEQSGSRSTPTNGMVTLALLSGHPLAPSATSGPQRGAGASAGTLHEARLYPAARDSGSEQRRRFPAYTNAVNLSLCGDGYYSRETDIPMS